MHVALLYSRRGLLEKAALHPEIISLQQPLDDLEVSSGRLSFTLCMSASDIFRRIFRPLGLLGSSGFGILSGASMLRIFSASHLLASGL